MNLFNTFAKTRLRRLLFSVFAPPVAGGLILILVDLFQARTLSVQWSIVFSVILFGYVFMGLQSLVAGLIMEFIVLELAVHPYQMVLAGILLGVLAGTTLAWMTPAFALVGASVGLMIGWVYRQCIRSHPQ